MGANVFMTIFFIAIIFIFSITFLIIMASISKASRQSRTVANEVFRQINNSLSDHNESHNAQDSYSRTFSKSTIDDHNADHDAQANYSQSYARKNSDSGDIKDKPLSEAEKNVLFGK